MYYLPITILFAFYGCICVIIALQHRARKETRDTFFNDMAMAFIMFMCAGSYPFMYANRGVTEGGQALLFIIFDVIIYSFLGVLFICVIREAILAKKNPARKVERGYDAFLARRKKEFDDNPAFKVKMDTNRKYLHLIPVGVIIVGFLSGAILEPVILPLGITGLGFAFFFIVLVGYGFVAMFMLAETYRLLNGNSLFYLDPYWAHKWFKSSIKDEEVQSFISSIPIVLCLMPFVFGPIAIFTTVGMISCLSDAAASVFGKRFGKRRLPMNSKKTYVGLFAGGLVTFGATLITFMTIGLPGVTEHVVLVMIIAAGTAFIFMLIDMYAKLVGDNFLNPLLCGAFMVLVTSFFI